MSGSSRGRQPSGLSVVELSKRYSSAFELHNVSFDVRPGEIVAMLGASGSGKSSILHLIAGLGSPDSGDIQWHGRSMLSLPPHQRRFGLMFQDLALFPHMTVAENTAFGLRMQRLPVDDIANRVAGTLELVGLAGYGARRIDTLSGGEQQRVALARALAPEPRLIMLDEPLAALDRSLKDRLTQEMPRILRQSGQTTLYVTHDQQEAFTLADRVVILQSGRVAQIGRPRQVYAQPASASVAHLLGLVNQFTGQAKRLGNATVLQTSFGDLTLPEASQGEVTVLVRPDMAVVGGSGPQRIEGIVVATAFMGRAQTVRLQAADQSIVEFTFPTSVELPSVGEIMTVSFDPSESVQVLQP